MTTPKWPKHKFRVGDIVRKVGGDYVFQGEVRMRGRKRSGAIRYAVEDDRGILHVFGPNNLEMVGRLGHGNSGERSPTAKLNEKQVEVIRTLLSIGWNVARTANAFGVARETVANIRDGKSWKTRVIDGPSTRRPPC